MRKINNKKNWCVYKHTSPSGKVYIGITSNIKRRWEGNGCAYKSCNKFFNAIKKYGWNNLTHEVLYDNLERTQANILEISLIRFYKNKGISYNITNGGEGTSGIVVPEERRRKISEIHKGNKYSLGRKQSEEEKERRRIAITGKKRTLETRRKLSESSKKKVYRYDLNGLYIDCFDSALDAQNELGISRSKIGACCLKKRKSAGGFIWRFSKEHVDKYKNDKYIKIVMHNINTGEDFVFDTMKQASEKTGISFYYIYKCIKNNTIHENCTWRKEYKNKENDKGNNHSL